MFVRLAFLIAILVALSWGCPVGAQVATSGGDLKITAVGGGEGAGPGWMRDHQWATAKITIKNEADRDRNVLVTFEFINVTPRLQYAREAWVPANASRIIVVPVNPHEHHEKKNKNEKLKLRTIDAHALAIENVGGREVRHASDSPKMILARDEFSSAILNVSSRGGIEDPREQMRKESLEISDQIRMLKGLEKGATTLRIDDLPSTPLSLGVMQHLIVAREHPDLTPAQMEAIRLWLIEGGSLWICLDRVDPEWAAALLGEDWTVSYVDRLPLNRFTIEDANRADRKYPVDVEQSVELMRVVAPGFDTMHEVSGWPASLTRSIGRGRLLVTTLGASGWLAAAQEEKDGGPLKSIADYTLYQSRERNRRDPVQQVMQPLVAGQIGYEVTSRQTVATILFGLVGGLVLVGVVLWWLDRMAWMAAAGSALALVVCVVLLWIGAANRGSAPLTVSAGQLVRIEPGQRAMTVEGSVGVYNPNLSDVTVTGEGSVLWPQLRNQGKLVRMVWTDIDRYRWDNLSPEAGQVTYFEQRGQRLADSVSGMGATVDERGLRLVMPRINGEPLTDVVVVSSAGIATPVVDGDALRLPVDAPVANASRSIMSPSLTNTQRRRQAVYRDLLGNPSEFAEDRYLLLGWTDKLRSGAGVARDATFREQSLVLCELDIVPPGAGRPVSVPWVLMPFEEISIRELLPSQSGKGARVQGLGVVRMYQPIKGEWTAVSQAGRVALRFQLPEALRGLEVQSATFRTQLKGPGRLIKVQVWKDGKFSDVRRIENADGEVVVKIDDATLRSPDEAGRYYIVVEAGQPERPEAQWKIDEPVFWITGSMPGTADQ